MEYFFFHRGRCKNQEDRTGLGREDGRSKLRAIILLVFCGLIFGLPAQANEDDFLKEILQEDKSLLDFLPKEELQEKKKPKFDEKLLKPGFKSEVDLKCLEKKFSGYQYRLTLKVLYKWIDGCRAVKTKNCRIDEENSDTACTSRAEGYYEFVLTEKAEKTIDKKCMKYKMSCMPKKDLKKGKKRK